MKGTSLARGQWACLGALAFTMLACCVLAAPSARALGETSRAVPHVELSTPTLRPGNVGTLDIASAGFRVCELSFQGPQNADAGPFRVASRGLHVRWSWRVSRQAAAGVWIATVGCAATRHDLNQGARRIKEPFVVSRSTAHGTTLFSTSSLHARVTKTPPTGRATPTGGHVIGLGGAGNPFPYGQCTYRAFETRPDMYEFAVAHGIPRGGLASNVKYGGYPDYWWNAWRWLSNAQRVGYPTGTVPVAKALVVFPRGYGGSSVGHIAYVESVNPNGSYYVSERNWNHNPSITRRLVPPGVSGVAFIYGGPAGSGPTAQPPSTPQPPSPPIPPPSTASKGEAPNRAAITSYNRIEPGAPHFNVFEVAWERFTAGRTRLHSSGRPWEARITQLARRRGLR